MERTGIEPVTSGLPVDAFWSARSAPGSPRA